MLSWFFNNYIIISVLVIIEIFFLYFFSIASKKINFVDTPNLRKIHKGSIPISGGIAIFAILSLYFLIFDNPYFYKIIFIGSILIFIIGIIDDYFQISFIQKFFFQLLSCLIIVGFGLKIETIGNYYGYEILLGNYSIIITCLIVVGFVNAVNFTDGVDGLCTSYLLAGLISIIFFSYSSSSSNDLNLLYFLILILFVFLFSNFNIIIPKSFLGDSGSTSIAFIFGFVMIYLTSQSNNYFHPVLTIWAVPIVLYDFFNVVFKRIFKKMSPFKPDLNHFHYSLLKYNFTHIQISFFNFFLSIMLSLSGYYFYKFFGSAQSLMLFFFFFGIFIIFNFIIENEK